MSLETILEAADMNVRATYLQIVKNLLLKF
jgi:hypothetical protein